MHVFLLLHLLLLGPFVAFGMHAKPAVAAVPFKHFFQSSNKNQKIIVASASDTFTSSINTNKNTKDLLISLGVIQIVQLLRYIFLSPPNTWICFRVCSLLTAYKVYNLIASVDSYKHFPCLQLRVIAKKLDFL